MISLIDLSVRVEEHLVRCCAWPFGSKYVLRHLASKACGVASSDSVLRSNARRLGRPTPPRVVVWGTLLMTRL